MDLSKDKLEDLYKSLPDNDTLLEFDSFLLGEGSVNLLDQDFEEIGCSLTDEEDIVQEDDKEQFSEKVFRYDSLEDLISAFKEVKKGVFIKYDYFKVLAGKYNYPVKIADLILSDTDNYLVRYLLDNSIDNLSISLIAKLSAYRDMKIDKVLFKDLDSCPLCSSKDGLQYSLDYLFNIYCSGSYFSHPGCSCDLLPVLDRSKEYPFKVFEDLVVGSTEVKKAPVEFSDYIIKIIEKSNKNYDIIEFVDLKKYMGDSYDSNLVAFEENTMGQKKLILGNLYIGFYNALYFLENWMFDYLEDTKKEEPKMVDPEDYQEVYFYNGREVFRYKGQFYDCSTKELVNLEEL